MKTWRGVLSLFISFMVFAGWAYVLILLGTLSQNAALIAIGTAVALFWAGPFTPLIPIVLLVAFLIQRYIFQDRSNDEALKETIKKFRQQGFKTNEEVLKSNRRKIKYSRIHKYKKLYQKKALRGYYVYK
ncbi:MAG: hypothetical protein ACOX56_04565 [Acholeplasmataceae bacterium]|jgi:hypothetical protein